jgi:hypothetical protein
MLAVDVLRESGADSRACVSSVARFGWPKRNIQMDFYPFSGYDGVSGSLTTFPCPRF